MILSDMGERRILREILPRYVDGIGDDCANIGILEGTAVVSTDPVPLPAANVIGGDADLYWLGWLLVTINASDIAAAGARPHSFLAALDLPGDLDVRDFERLLTGIKASCSANRLKYVGGNIREAQKIAAVGTAIGSTVGQPLGRKGARPGHKVAVFGKGGLFWADAERVRAGSAVDKETSPLFSPVSQAPYLYRLHEAGLIQCAMDTSDGLAPTLSELASVNSLSIEVDLLRIRAVSQFSDVSIRAERLWMGWGDWAVVAAVEEERLNDLARACDQDGITYSIIGEFVEGTAVRLVDGVRSIPMGRLESERFAADSWFTVGIDEYIRRLHAFVLP
ncbi:thiamine-monophosphate kinase [Rhizobium ruizarguesonis]